MKEILNLDLVIVRWYDCTDHNEVMYDDLGSTEFREYVTERITCGFLYSNGDEGMILIRDIADDNTCEITAIPRSFKPEVIDVLGERSEQY